ncbi:hypothetical protein FGO68_gene15112 [Halteria grandinella]|uniref:Uncharacterized protein n=1 Tax=Halteria grandinella TaxID=5974 RepID=A0A8J8SVC7_HALGN|nr:hypothetical protein FGO68_gene15112 [Halteria grandinella]
MQQICTLFRNAIETHLKVNLFRRIEVQVVPSEIKVRKLNSDEIRNQKQCSTYLMFHSVSANGSFLKKLISSLLKVTVTAQSEQTEPENLLFLKYCRESWNHRPVQQV